VWVGSDGGGGTWDKEAPFGWKCDECLAEDCEKADDRGYIVPDQDALNDAAEAAWERQQAANLECPPLTMDEQHMAAWKQKQGLR
jgi:hypothetical protein